MRLIPLLFVLVIMPSTLFAQMPRNMDPSAMMQGMGDPAAMQRMAQEAEAASKCMESIKKSRLDELQRRGEAASKEIDALCAEGKRDAAMKRAMQLGREMNSDPTVLKLRECTKGMTQMMETMPWTQIPGVAEDDEPKDSDICS